MASKQPRVPTAEELNKRAESEKELQAPEPSLALAGEGDASPEPPRPEPLPPPPPEPKRRVRVDQVFYWRQGPGLPGIPVPPGSELSITDREIADIIAQGGRVTIVDASFRARAIAAIEALPRDRMDPAPLVEEIAALEASIASVIAKIRAFHDSGGS